MAMLDKLNVIFHEVELLTIRNYQKEDELRETKGINILLELASPQLLTASLAL